MGTLYGLIRRFINTRHGWLISVFSFYLIVLFVFAAIYFAMYRLSPNDFLFNADVAQSQKVRYNSETTKALKINQEFLNALRELHTQITNRIAPIENKAFLNPYLRFNTKKASFAFRLRYHCVRFCLYTVTLAALTPEGQDILLKEVEVKEEKLDFPEFAQVTTSLIEDKERQIKEQIDSLTETTYPANAWSYWDFVYFSGITLSTVGFGDILPNTTPVRIVVIIEVMIGLLLFVVVINLAATKS